MYIVHRISLVVVGCCGVFHYSLLQPLLVLPRRRLRLREDLRLLQAGAGACVCPRRDAGAAARARRSPRAEPSTGVVDGPQGGEAREGDASGGCRRRE